VTVPGVCLACGGTPHIAFTVDVVEPRTGRQFLAHYMTCWEHLDAVTQRLRHDAYHPATATNLADRRLPAGDAEHPDQLALFALGSGRESRGSVS
jgi:hypothetical protein